MDGFLVGLGVSLFLTFINIAFIWYAKRIHGISAVAMVQAGMLVKFMLGAIISFCIIKLAEINLWAYALTLGMFVCIAFPITAYVMTNE